MNYRKKWHVAMTFVSECTLKKYMAGKSATPF